MSDNNSTNCGFFSALIGSFSGTEIFFRLKDQKMWRTILHLIFMLIICSIAVAVIRNSSGVSPVKQTSELMNAVFGGAVFDYENGQVLPQKSPQESRSILLPEQGLLSYVASGSLNSMPQESKIGDFRYIVYWFPSEFFIVNQASSDRFIGLSLGVGNSLDKFNIENYNLSEIEKKLSTIIAENSTATPLGEKYEEISIQQLAFQYTITEIFAFIIGGILQIAIFTLMFIGFFSLTNRGRLKRLQFKSLMNCALYAGLPAMFVASAFPAFDLPLLSFGSAYMLGVAFYLMFIIRKIELSEIAK